MSDWRMTPEEREAERVQSIVDEITALRAALDQERAKGLRFDLDQIGIEHREREAVELVNLRADIVRYRDFAQHHDECAKWWSNAEGDRWVSDDRPCTCGLSALLSGRGEGS